MFCWVSESRLHHAHYFKPHQHVYIGVPIWFGLWLRPRLRDCNQPGYRINTRVLITNTWVQANFSHFSFSFLFLSCLLKIFVFFSFFSYFILFYLARSCISRLSLLHLLLSFSAWLFQCSSGTKTYGLKETNEEEWTKQEKRNATGDAHADWDRSDPSISETAIQFGRYTLWNLLRKLCERTNQNPMPAHHQRVCIL